MFETGYQACGIYLLVKFWKMKNETITQDLYETLLFFRWRRQHLTDYKEGYLDLIRFIHRIDYLDSFEEKRKIETLFSEEVLLWQIKLRSYNIESEINYEFRSRFSKIKYLIPSKRREEIIGDLIETEFQMIEAGMSEWKIKMVMMFHIFLVVFSLLRIRVSDFGTSKKIE